MCCISNDDLDEIIGEVIDVVVDEIVVIVDVDEFGLDEVIDGDEYEVDEE